MTSYWILAYVVMPFVVVAMGGLAVLLHERSLNGRRNNRAPGE